MTAVHDIREHPGRNWTPWDSVRTATLMRLRERGCKRQHIADVMNTTIYAIDSKLLYIKQLRVRVKAKASAAKAPVEEVKKSRPCLGGCGRVIVTTIKVRICPSCKESPLFSSGYG